MDFGVRLGAIEFESDTNKKRSYNQTASSLLGSTIFANFSISSVSEANSCEKKMTRQRSSTRSVLLSDESSHLLLRAQSFASARPTSPTAAAGVTAAPKKAHRKLGTVFRCPICKRCESVECRIDPKRKCAEASCWACEASHRTAADALTEPIDVYCEWIDERRRANEGGGVRRDYDGDVMMADS